MKNTALTTLIFITLFSSSLWAGKINRAQFTSNIIDREPVDALVVIPNDIQKATYFTELFQFNGETITHQWMYNGKEMYRLSFNVGGSRWRTWSSKRMLPKWSGEWKVNVLDSKEQVVHSDSFYYQPE